jgi:transcription initiation factor TFIID subunit TAF12
MLQGDPKPASTNVHTRVLSVALPGLLAGVSSLSSEPHHRDVFPICSDVWPLRNRPCLWFLSALPQAFKLQPDLVDQLQQLTESFVSEAVKFGVDLASHRRGATLRPTDLAMYLERTHHLHVPGFTKEYHPYRRPVASELHKERSIAVRKAQLAAAAAGGDAPAAAAARGGGGGD